MVVIGIMVALIDTAKAQKKLAEHARTLRLQLNLTQEGLAARSGVSLSTLRKFEQKGSISLESFLKIHMALGTLETFLRITQTKDTTFSSIDDVLKANHKFTRKRGTRK